MTGLLSMESPNLPRAQNVIKPSISAPTIGKKNKIIGRFQTSEGPNS